MASWRSGNDATPPWPAFAGSSAVRPDL